jgi:hypothetical protein
VIADVRESLLPPDRYLAGKIHERLLIRLAVEALHAWHQAVETAKHHRWLVRKSLARKMERLKARVFMEWVWWRRHSQIMANLLGIAEYNLARAKCRRIMQVRPSFALYFYSSN